MYYCLDSEQLAEQYPPLNNSQDYYYKLQICSSIKEALDSLINGYLIVLNVYNDDGSVGVGNNPQYVGSLSSPNHGVQCLNCGSTNLQYDRDYGRYYCTNKGCTAGYTKVATYFDYAEAIYNISVDLNFPLIFRYIKTPCFHNEGF
ncbi:unknown [Roseburia sp. CAG:309]|nr:unknown [Roseburia sp. CAG:309]